MVHETVDGLFSFVVRLVSFCLHDHAEQWSWNKKFIRAGRYAERDIGQRACRALGLAQKRAKHLSVELAEIKNRSRLNDRIF